MIQGIFIKNAPWIEVLISWGKSVRKPLAILDTGFSGDLQVTSKTAKELNLQPKGVVQMTIANGDVVSSPMAVAIATIEGVDQLVDVIISDSVPLVGINLLSKFSYKAIVDCHNKTVALQKVT